MSKGRIRPSDDEVVQAVRAQGNRNHTVSVHAYLVTQYGSMLPRSWTLEKLKQLEAQGRVVRAESAYKVAMVWRAT